MNPHTYLTERVSKVVLNSDKVFNEGARLLAHYSNWETELDSYITTAWDTLMRYCLRNKQAKYTASVKLTFASNLIGQQVAKAIMVDDTDIKSTLSLGDLFLEAFLQDGLIDIFREYDGKKAPYLVQIVNMTDDVKPTLIGTVFEPPAAITGLASPVTKLPFIKGWRDNSEFKKYLEMPFIRALEALRMQPWKLNNAVLTAMLQNPPEETLDVVDKHGEIYKYNIHHENLKLPKKLFHVEGSEFLGKKDPKLQKLVSKYFEYQQIVKKAEMIGSRTFYQEVSCDYRGRVYYAESFLEFQGSDLARSLFLFEQRKAVTEQGFYWFCVHAASCYNQSYTVDELKKLKWLDTDYIAYLKEEGLDTISVDKMTLKDRAMWTEKNIRLILDTAKTKNVDTNAEKAYSFLAVCIEIAAYKKAMVLGEQYTSGLPIPIDGSNNGDRLPL